MEDLDHIVDTIGKDREKDHQVRLIYNELVNEISETFGFHWIKPQDPQVTNQEKGESMEAGEVSNFNPTSETEPTNTQHQLDKCHGNSPTLALSPKLSQAKKPSLFSSSHILDAVIHLISSTLYKSTFLFMTTLYQLDYFLV